LKKDKDVLRKKKGALGSKKVMYFRTKFECSKIIYFGTEGISSLWKLTLKTKDQNTDGHVLEKGESCIEKREGALGSKKIMYFRTKFKCSKIIYFGIERIHSRGRTFRPQRQSSVKPLANAASAAQCSTI
jgi:hypothetical protein